MNAEKLTKADDTKTEYARSARVERCTVAHARVFGRCEQNCEQEVDRDQALFLRAYCSANSSDLGQPCSGSVHWELAALSLASEDPQQRQNLTKYADGGANLTATSDAFPETTSSVAYEVKASG